MKADEQLELKCINAIRCLSIDMVQQAKSGHPGMPLGAAAMAFVLWDRFLKHNPAAPSWPDRDRFILSAGHASSMLYSLLHLTGYDLSLDEIKNFRQWDSKTPGHPERCVTPGVEMTTGPLGQGFAHGVGMAVAESWLAAHYNKPGHEIIDHFTYAIVSDGDLQEGVSYEAASLAGTLKLGKLIYLYDDNGIQIEGETCATCGDDTAKRFEALGWQAIGPIDGFDLEAIDAAIHQAQQETQRPSLIICKTTIGYGSPLAGSEKTHGAPLGPENVDATKEKLGWPTEPKFYVPDDVREYMAQAFGRGQKAQDDWKQAMEAYAEEHGDLAAKLEQQLAGRLPDGWDEPLQNLFTEPKAMATRAASGKALNALGTKIDNLIGGSADLGPSNKTVLDDYGEFSADNHAGNNLRFGVREHAMGAVAGGIALHGGMIPYTGTFLIFADYMRPPMRLAALMKQRVIYVFSHDSIGLGEDGPTHQPIEQLMNLRSVPNLTVIRPADAPETAEAWRAALRNETGPTVIVTSRQNVPVLDREILAPASSLQRGGYVLWQAERGTPDVILIGAGSELSMALEAGKTLAVRGVNARVVSLPCWKLFDRQPVEYREEVLPPDVHARVAVEAGLAQGWERYLGLDGIAVGLDGFGASAPANELYERFGITTERVVEAAERLV